MFSLLSQKTKNREKQLDILTALIAEFENQNKADISFPELLETLEELNDFLPIRYPFPAPCSYPPDLYEHLQRLEENGFIRRFKIQHNGFLPKTFINLTALGRGHANKILKQLVPEQSGLIEVMRKHAQQVIRRSEEDWWRLWGRRQY